MLPSSCQIQLHDFLKLNLDKLCGADTAFKVLYVLQEIRVDAALGAVGILEVSRSVMKYHCSYSREIWDAEQHLAELHPRNCG